MTTNELHDPEQVIKTLRNEKSQDIDTLEQIRVVLESDPEFHGLSLVGGVKAILRRLKEEQEKNFLLERENKKLARSKGY